PAGEGWLFDLDHMALVGKAIDMPGYPPEASVVAGLDPDTGNAILLYAPQQGFGGTYRIAAIAASPDGPTIVADEPLDAHLGSSTPGYELTPEGLDVLNGKVYVAAASNQSVAPVAPEVA